MLDTFKPLLEAARGLRLDDPAAAEALLNERFDPAGEAAAELNRKLLELYEAGEIADRGELPVKWGRALKPSDESHGYSVDVVYMTAPGPEHRHPRGEIDYAIRTKGDPSFDGRPPGWIVLGEGSRHVPSVTGGEMLIVYLLPGGEIDFIQG